MGKGVVPDSHSLCVASARTFALQNADIILLLGARLNWILHFGKSPRFNVDVKFIQIDINAEELHNSQQASVAIQADVQATVNTLSVCLTEKKWHCVRKDWLNRLVEKCTANKKYVEVSYIRTNMIIKERIFKFLHNMYIILCSSTGVKYVDKFLITRLKETLIYFTH